MESDHAQDLLVGYLPHRYVLIRSLGGPSRDGTFLVQDRGLRRTEAVLKFQELSAESCPTTEERAFLDFCSRLRTLRNPHVAAPYTFGVVRTVEGRTLGYTVREFIHGQPLSELPEPTDYPSLVLVAAQICRALEVLHHAGVAHGDLKPENVIVKRASGANIDDLSQCVLIDLTYRAADGISQSRLTDVTLQYVPPEVTSGGGISTRSDLFALGVLMYKRLSGRYPFDGHSIAALIRAQSSRDYTPLTALCPETPDSLVRVIDKLLDPRAEHRPESASVVLAMLTDMPRASHITIRNLYPAQRLPILVGREEEVTQCVNHLLGLRGFSVATCLQVCASSGGGTTSVLRELQDRLESMNVATLSVQPCLRSGRCIHDQLAEPLQVLARTVDRSGSAARAVQAAVRTPQSPSELLDDLVVASSARPVVVIIDDAQLVNAEERDFIVRVARVAKSTTVGACWQQGGLRVVLGASGGDDGDVDEPESPDSLVDARVRLRPLTPGDVQELFAASLGGETWSHDEASLVVEATEGNPARCIAIVDYLSAASSAPASRRTRLLEAIDACCAQQETRQCDADATNWSLDPRRLAIAAVTLWGESVSVSEWRALVQWLYGEDAVTDLPAAWFAQRVSDCGDQLITLRRSVSPRLVAATIDSADAARIAQAVARAWKHKLRFGGVAVQRAVLRLAASCDGATNSLKWRTLRALLVLLRDGNYNEVDLRSRQIARGGRASEKPWWVSLVGAVARSEQGDPTAVEQRANGAMEEHAHSEQLFAGWARARTLVRRNEPIEATRLLKSIANAEAAGTAWRASRRALLEDLGRMEAAAGNWIEAKNIARQLVKDARHFRMVAQTLTWRRSGVGGPTVRMGWQRQLASALRIRCRAAIVRRHYRAAASFAHRESSLWRQWGGMAELATSLTSEGISRMHSGQSIEAVERLAEAAMLTEKQGDERRLAAALINVAHGLALTGEFSRAAGALNRARVVAERNDLSFERDTALLNLAFVYSRIGQLADSRRLLYRLVRPGRATQHHDVLAQALYSYGRLAIDQWYPEIATRCADALRRVLPRCGRVRHEISPDELLAHRAVRLNDWSSLRQLVYPSDSGQGQECWQVEYRCIYYENGRDARQRRRSRLPIAKGARLEAVVRRALLSCQRLSMASLRRLVRLCEDQGKRQAVWELYIAALAHATDGSAQLTADALRLIGAPQYREGYDDLQVRLRAELARKLSQLGRTREARRLMIEAVERFGQLARKCRRCKSYPQPVRISQESLMRSLGRGGRARGVRTCTEASNVMAAAFHELVKSHGSRGGTCAHDGDSMTDAVERCLTAILLENDPLARTLDSALDVLGAERAMLIWREADGKLRVELSRQRMGCAQCNGDPELSWAVVSQVLQDGRTVIYSDAVASEELASHRSIAALNLRSLACVPVRWQGGVSGCLYLDHRSVAGLFAAEDIKSLEVFAGLIANAKFHLDAAREMKVVSGALADAHRNLVKTERSRVAAQLVGGVAHDLKNLIATIVARTQLSLMQLGDGTVVRTALRGIERAAHLCVGMIDRLQDCTRDAGVVEELVDVATVVGDAMELVAPRARSVGERGIDIRYECVASGVVRGVSMELREVFLNLMLNACDAMPNGGTVWLRVDRSGDRVIVEVKDSGQGIPESVQRRIFEPFFTTKGKAGTGLGLTVVRDVVVRHGGSVTVHSRPGHGATFSVSLPMVGDVDLQGGARAAVDAHREERPSGVEEGRKGSHSASDAG